MPHISGPSRVPMSKGTLRKVRAVGPASGASPCAAGGWCGSADAARAPPRAKAHPPQGFDPLKLRIKRRSGVRFRFSTDSTIAHDLAEVVQPLRHILAPRRAIAPIRTLVRRLTEFIALLAAGRPPPRHGAAAKSRQV